MKIHSLPTSIDLSKCILWQYQNATRLQTLIQMMQDGTEMASVDLWKKAFYAFDLDRELSSTDDDYQYRIHGLHAISNLLGLKRPRWTSGGLSSLVSDNTWRLYIKGMIWLMDSDGSGEDINKWLKIIFPDYLAYIKDNLNMTITYRFFPVPATQSEEWQLLNIDGFLPHPAGVLATLNAYNDAILGTDGQNEGQLNASRFGGFVSDVIDLEEMRGNINLTIDILIRTSAQNPFDEDDKIATSGTPAQIVTLYNRIRVDSVGFDFSSLTALSTSSTVSQMKTQIDAMTTIVQGN